VAKSFNFAALLPQCVNDCKVRLLLKSYAMSLFLQNLDMDAACVSSLGSSIVSLFASAPIAWLSYDMFNPTDTFGKMMRSNIESSAGYKIPGFTDFPTLASHETKFVDVGFSAETTKACSMLGNFFCSG